MTEDVDTLPGALAEPFEPGEVKWKPQSVSGNRALMIAYVDARVIQDRLDDVLGVMGWQDSYECLPDGAVVCRLRIRVGAEWITKEDVGGQSEQPDEGDRRKAAFSDALKRAAVKFGVGRYLYRLPHQWVDYDPQKRRAVSQPTLPPWAVPKAKARPPQQPAPKPQPAADGVDVAAVHATAVQYEADLVAGGWCKLGDLINHLEVKLGDEWERKSSADIREAIKAFLAARNAAKTAKAGVN